MSQWISQLTPGDKAAMAFATTYERVRRKRQRGYRMWNSMNNDVRGDPKFKTARTVAAWFETRWRSTRKEANLEGYIEYVFRTLSPTIPHLGQLKNEIFIKEFIAATPAKVDLNSKSNKDLHDLYRKVLCKEFRSTKALGVLGLLSERRE